MQTQVLISSQKFSKNPLTILLITTILGLFFYGITTFWVASKSLEEVIDDDVVWQEVKDLQIPAETMEKMISEIEGIKAKTRIGNPCAQYVLEATLDGWYYCHHLPSKRIYLNAGQTWKIGKTCMEDDTRYQGGFPDERLLMFREFEGTAEQCLLVEKVKLYAYFLSTENMSRTLP